MGYSAWEGVCRKVPCTPVGYSAWEGVCRKVRRTPSSLRSTVQKQKGCPQGAQVPVPALSEAVRPRRGLRSSQSTGNPTSSGTNPTLGRRHGGPSPRYAPTAKSESPWSRFMAAEIVRRRSHVLARVLQRGDGAGDAWVHGAFVLRK